MSEPSFLKINQIAPTENTGVIVAALDMGSNSFHLVVARGHGHNNFEVLLKEKVMMRLGDEVAQNKVISNESAKLIKETVATMASLASGVGASEMVALATAAFRDARNAGIIVDDLEETLGIKVSVISGQKEAELIWNALTHGVDFNGEMVIGADLGGGSMEITAGTQDALAYAKSFAVGVGRLTTQFSSSKAPSGIDSKSLRSHLEATLANELLTVKSEIVPTTLILSSGSFLNIARMALLRTSRAQWENTSINQAEIAISQLRSICSDLTKLDQKSRSKLYGIDEKRIDLLPAGAEVLGLLLDTLKPARVITSEWALREGIILRELSQRSETEFEGSPESIKLASLTSVAARYGWNEGHSRQVANLGLEIFDQTKGLHNLGDSDRELLYLAALVHDIGEYISVEGHDRHGAYLLENSRLPGFNKDERNELLSIVRYHRRGTPKSDYGPFGELTKARAIVVTKLAAILRLGDALDRSHSRIVEKCRIVTNSTQVLLFVTSPTKIELEEYGLRRKRQLFEDTFNREVHLIQE
ncbi:MULTISPECIES: Ppx/GppA phosphatase family protein [Acidithrix]|uniref:Exopolyphosphatase n=1 Tax=Acidithrix ferrooxidans TaxID=1280514 RepID=A0A0D8HLP2_9ACTN|nr:MULTISPECIES: Ppx/GppA phosphatase family protein [Acidithrix]KJF18828.1 exopolyphosphatase [Acidithrix ferrooxidans]CAG4921979.1 unnamed protein product [Acidithrix sp. C25]